MRKPGLFFVFLSTFIMIPFSGTIVCATYHHVEDCTVCHWAKECMETSNLKMIWDTIATPNSGDKTVVFTSRTGDNSFADGDETHDGVCEVCHTTTKYHRNNPSGNHTHYAGTDCILCHRHVPNEFTHGGPATGCQPCHGHDHGYSGEGTGGSGTFISHSTHTEADSDDLMGPNITCSGCHETNSYPNFADGATNLDDTTVCDNCHSKGGAFNGVAMAKGSWHDGIYEEDGKTLKSENEKWCASCHDGEPAHSRPEIIEHLEIVVDDANATFVSVSDGWRSASGYYKYRDSARYSSAGSGADTATWRPDLPKAGKYRVWAWWVSGATATNAPYTIYYKDGGSKTVRVDQTQYDIRCRWTDLGVYDFAAGTSGCVTLSDDADGTVIADAVKLEWVYPGEIIVDTQNITFDGDWTYESDVPWAYSDDHRYLEGGDTLPYGTATWTPNISAAGSYRVYACWQEGDYGAQEAESRASNAKYTIYHKDGGSATVQVDQRAHGSHWNYLGTYSFDAGESGYVELSSEGNGVVIADAIKLEPGAPEGTYAPNVVGDNETYGFYVTGHKIDCISCHDSSMFHLDHEHRSYSALLDNYQAGYRLRSVNGGKPLNVPKPDREHMAYNYLDDYALCFDCHNYLDVIGEDINDKSHTNFRTDEGENQPYNGHGYHIATRGMDFDSDWDNVEDSRQTCIACHNVHGAPNQVMIRHGELITTNRTLLNLWDTCVQATDFNALNFAYLEADGNPDTTVGLEDSTGSKMDWYASGAQHNGTCQGGCHSWDYSITRSPYLGPRVIMAKANPETVADDGSGSSLITAFILDHDSDLSSVEIDLTPIGGDSNQGMYDNGSDGDVSAGDGIFSCLLTIPGGAPDFPLTFVITATDNATKRGYGAATVNVVDPDSIYVDNPDAEFVCEWGRSSSGGYEDDYRWHPAGDGSCKATWRPDLVAAGTYNVYAWWKASSNRATNAKYTIYYDDDSQAMQVNQEIDGSQWNLLGSFPFAAGTSGYVVLSDDADEYVIADAIKLVPQP